MRDKLAFERTKLANERTFLAYVRTSLSLIAGAAVIFQFFSSVQTYVFLAWIFAVLGVIVLVIGIYRFNSLRSELAKEASFNESA